MRSGSLAIDDAVRPEADACQEIESLAMPDGTWVISDGSSFWLQRPDFLGGSPFSPRLLQPGNALHTRQILAGALTAGYGSRPRSATPPEPRMVSLPGYIHQLAGSYQTTHATPETMRHVAERLRAAGDGGMADYCLHVGDEEEGHDRLALKDLEALGVRAADFVRDVRPANAMALVELFKGYAGGTAPLAILGYAYVLERMALFQTRESIDAVEALLPPGTMATRCLRVHSAVGTDARHVVESIDVIAGLCEADRMAIAAAVFETAACMAAPTDYPGDTTFGALLSTYMN